MYMHVGTNVLFHVYTKNTVIWGILLLKKFCTRRSTKIQHTKYYQHTYHINEQELNYHRVGNFFCTNILHKYFLTRKFPQLQHLIKLNGVPQHLAKELDS